MKTILTNKWHLHFTIGADIMVLLLILFSYSQSLEFLGGALIATMIAAWGFSFFEWLQNKWLNRVGQTQETKAMFGDILAGVAGCIFVALLFATKSIYLEIIILVALNIYTYILNLKRKK